MSRAGTKTHVVVGAGQAGAHAAIAMRQAGIEGRIVLVGEEAATPYDRTSLSKSFLAADVGGQLVHSVSPASFALEGIELVTGIAVEAIEPDEGRVRLAFGGSIPFDSLVLATGSAARRLSVPGADHVLVLRGFADAERLRRRFEARGHVVCIGAGVVGLELASAARARGCAVTVVETADTLMSRSLDPDFAEAIGAIHRRAGVELLFGVQAVAIEPEAVLLSDGTRLPADVMVAGIGAVRNTALARDAGLEVARGIVVDASGRTSREGIFAAGEVAEYYSARAGTHVVLESWRHAQDHGRLVGRVVAGFDEAYDEVPWFWTDQHDANIQVAGSVRNADHAVCRGDPDSASFSIFYLDSLSRVVGAVALNAGRDISAAIRVIRNGSAVDPGMIQDVGIALRRLVAFATEQRTPV